MFLALVLVVAQAEPFAKWEKEVAAIEARLKKSPPAPGGVLFAGSSTIRLWKLDDSFPDLKATNVGFGGSTIPACTHFVKRLVTPHKPKTVVFYAGDNDIAEGRTADQVADDFAAFVKAVRATLPECRILYLPVKPSIKRWDFYDVQTAANRKVKAFVEKGERLGYIDIVPLTLGADGKPDPALFIKDGLHLSPAGYAKWAPAVKAAIK